MTSQLLEPGIFTNECVRIDRTRHRQKGLPSTIVLARHSLIWYRCVALSGKTTFRCIFCINMAPFRTLFTLLVTLGVVSGFAPAKTASSQKSSLNLISSEGYQAAQEEWAEQFSPLAQYGWGPTVQAEKWNGRHAMFGWFFICATAYCKGHGLIPDAGTLLDLKQWGTLATISGKETISNERAVILIANAHAFGVGLMATICPPSFGDTLLLDPNHPSYDKMVERNAQGFGYMPALNFGMTEEAEILNGRLAMVGLISLVVTSCVTGQDMIDVVNSWVGGAYY